MKEDIQDSEIRVIGAACSSEPTELRRKMPWWIIILILAVVLSGILWYANQNKTEIERSAFEYDIAFSQPQPHPLQSWIASMDSISAQGTITKDTLVNDIPLRIYAPLNATPRLELGYEVIRQREKNILLFQAADVRADNHKIVGAFVLRGKPMSRGLSKQGYCAIINNHITVGVAENSPLFEEATEKDGYFFRQYALVNNGVLVENNLKNKYIRRGLCDLEGRVVVVESQTPESMHDFAQALVDIGATNAIYLVGSTAIGWSCDLDGNGTKMGLWDVRPFKNVSFIVWSR